MSGSKPDTRELFRRIAKLSSEAEWTNDETLEALSEAGVDTDDVASRLLEQVERAKRASPFHWKAKATMLRNQLLAKVRGRVTADTSGLARPELLAKVMAAINRLPNAAEYAVAFRKFGDATEEDLRSMLEEITLIEETEGADENQP